MIDNINAKVLLVDDEEDFLTALSQRLELRGLQVRTATSGEAAIAKIHEEEFDLIVLDLAMPGIDGIETLRKIKSIQANAEIVMLTGHGSIKTSMEAMKLGAEDFLEKPVDFSQLLEKIREAKDKRLLLLDAKNAVDIDTILKSKGW